MYKYLGNTAIKVENYEIIFPHLSTVLSSNLPGEGTVLSMGRVSSRIENGSCTHFRLPWLAERETSNPKEFAVTRKLPGKS